MHRPEDPGSRGRRVQREPLSDPLAGPRTARQEGGSLRSRLSQRIAALRPGFRGGDAPESDPGLHPSRAAITVSVVVAVAVLNSVDLSLAQSAMLCVGVLAAVTVLERMLG